MKMIIYISREGGEFLPTDIRSLETLHMYLSTLMTLTHAPYAKPRISLRDSRPGTGLQYILADLGRLSIACEAAPAVVVRPANRETSAGSTRVGPYGRLAGASLAPRQCTPAP